MHFLAVVTSLATLSYLYCLPLLKDLISVYLVNTSQERYSDFKICLPFQIIFSLGVYLFSVVSVCI